MSFPNVSEVLWDLTEPVIFQIIDTEIDDGEVTETAVNAFEFSGLLEPVDPQRLKILPENQRTWKFWTLWTYSKIALDVGMVVQDSSNRQYRVMAVSDWSTHGGFYKYRLAEDPVLDTPVPVPAT